MLRLRTADGLDMATFAATYGDDAAATVASALQPHLQSGRAQQLPRLAAGRQDQAAGSCLTGHAGGPPLPAAGGQWDLRFRLADPDGFLLSNTIISDVFSAFSFPSSHP